VLIVGSSVADILCLAVRLTIFYFAGINLVLNIDIENVGRCVRTTSTDVLC